MTTGLLMSFGAAAENLPQAMAQTTVRIDLSKPGIPVSPTLYGLMTEEINFSSA